MKVYLIAIILITTSLLFCVESYTLPHKLVDNELPSNYDHKIDDFANFFYEFVNCQDPDLDGNENEERVYKFFAKQDIKRLQKVKKSLWIFRNKYPFYLSEYRIINRPFLNIYDNESAYKTLSLFHANTEKKKWNKDDNYLNISDCIRILGSEYWEKTRVSPAPLLYNYYVCTINNYEVGKPSATGTILIKFSVNIEKQLGFESISELKDIYYITFSNIILDIKKDFKLDELIGKKYLIPVFFNSEAYTEDNKFKSKAYPGFDLEDIFQVVDNNVSTKIEKNYREITSQRTVGQEGLKYFLFKDKSVLSLDEVEKNILSFVR